MLEIQTLDAGYPDVPVLRGVSLRVGDGEFVAVLGPNGAGKTTLFKAISGTVGVTAGGLRFDGTDLLGVAPSRRAHLGIAHVPEGRQVFPSLTVHENLEMGAFGAGGRRAFADSLAQIHEWFPVLRERANALAGTLSGGQQQMLAIARGLASAPRLLMLDEPSMGLSPTLADEIFERIVAIHRDSRIAILMVEQRVAEALHHADRGYVLEAGSISLEGDRAALAGNDRVRQAYLGI
jgi:branched-chain amino acid transport system ATP-binding protein